MKLLFFGVLFFAHNAFGIKIPRKWRNNPIDTALYCKICHHIVFDIKRLLVPNETKPVKQCSKISSEGQSEECLKPAWNDEVVIVEAVENVCSIPVTGYMTKKFDKIPTRLLLGNKYNKEQVNEVLSDEDIVFDSDVRTKAMAMCANLEQDLNDVIFDTFQITDLDLIDTICQREIAESCGSTAGFTDKSLYAMHPRFLTEVATEKVHTL